MADAPGSTPTTPEPGGPTAPAAGTVTPDVRSGTLDSRYDLFADHALPESLRTGFRAEMAHLDTLRLVALLPVVVVVHLLDILAFGVFLLGEGAVPDAWTRLTVLAHGSMSLVTLALIVAGRVVRRVEPARRHLPERAFVATAAFAYAAFAATLAGIDQHVNAGIAPLAIAQLVSAILLTLPRFTGALVGATGFAVSVVTLRLFSPTQGQASSAVANALAVCLVAWVVGRILAGNRARAFADRVELAKRQDELRVANLALRHVATHDSLTGLANRAALFEQAVQLAALAKRQDRPLQLLVLDLDHFKEVNDKHGHAIGDAVLVGFAIALRASLRHSDVAGRVGGDEFVVLAPDTSFEGAFQLAERLREAAARVGQSTPEMPLVTVSIGVAQVIGADTAAVDAAYARADMQLYEAKRAGRDRVSSPRMRIVKP